MHRFLAIFLLCAACTPVGPYDRLIWFGNPERVWALTSLQGEKVRAQPGQVATLRLNPDHSVSGTVACNSRSAGKVRWFAGEAGDRGTFDQSGVGPGITTLAGCMDAAAMATADRFWELMRTARSWTIDGHVLIVEFGDGSQARLRALKRRGG